MNNRQTTQDNTTYKRSIEKSMKSCQVTHEEATNS